MTYGRYPYGGVAYAGSDVAQLPADTATHLAVEVSLTTGALEPPVWVDIATDVRSWDVSRGRRRELERFQPGRATVVLSNRSRQYDSVNVAGPHYGNLRPMRRIRIRETFNGVTYPVFDGYVDKWVLDYPGMGHDATATVVATDGFKIFQRTDLPKSVFDKAVADDAAGLYWKLDEPIEALVTREVINSGATGPAQAGTFFNNPTLGAQGLVVNDPGRSMFVPDSTLYANALVQGVEIPNSALDLLANTSFAFEGWARLEEGGANIGSPQGTLFRISQAGTTNLHASLLHQDDGTGAQRRLTWTVVIGGGASIYGVQTPYQSVVVGKIHHVVAVIEADQQMAIYLDGVRYTTTSDGGAGSNLTGQTRPTGGRVTIGMNGTTSAGAVQNWGGTIDNVAIYAGFALTQAQVTTHYQAGSAPWQNDLPGVRIVRILDIVGWPADQREIDPGLTTLQSATLGMPALEHLQKVAESEFGLLFMSRDGKFRFVDRTTLFGRAPLGYVYGDAADGVEVGYRDFTPDDGDDVIRNRARISRLNGSVRTAQDAGAIDEYGRFDYSLDGLYHRTEQYSQDYANLIVGEYADQRRRITSLALGPPAGSDVAAVYPAMLSPELGDAIVVRSRPIGGGTMFEQTCAVEGIEHAGRPGGQRTARLTLSPEFLVRALEDEDVATLGYAQVVANQTGITTLTDLAGLSVDVTVGSNRRIRITGQALVSRTVSDGITAGFIREGSTVLNRFFQKIPPNTGDILGTGSVVLTPSAGAHTYKLSLERSTGTGTVGITAGAGYPAFILVEDIGPV